MSVRGPAPTSGRATGRRSMAWVSTGGLLALVLCACGISTETAPRDIAPSGDAVVDDPTGDDNVATGPGRVYFVQVDAAGAPSRLVTVARDVPIGLDQDPTEVLAALVAGPNEGERGDGLASLLPRDLEVLGWSRRPGGVVAIDLGPGLAELPRQALIAALAQIVYSITETVGTDGVRITVEGSPREWPDGNGHLQDDVLTVHDYPGLLRSSQPAFPAIPSGRPATADA